MDCKVKSKFQCQFGTKIQPDISTKIIIMGNQVQQYKKTSIMLTSDCPQMKLQMLFQVHYSFGN